MRKISAGVILVMLLCGSAYADIVYTTDTGDLGLIRLASSTSADLRGTQYSGVPDNALLGGYWDGSNSRVILIDRTENAASSGDTALIFDPANLSAPTNSEAKVLAGVHNAQGVIGSYSGKGIFFSSGASIYEFSTGDYTLTRSYTYTPKTSNDIVPSISSMITGTYRLYALAKQENSGDVLLGFDGQLLDNVSSFQTVSLPDGTSMLSWLSNTRVAAAHNDGVSIWGRRGFVSIVSSDAPVRALCQDEGDGFYFAEGVKSGDEYITTLKHYMFDSRTVTTLDTGDTGTACQLLRDDDKKVLAAITGSKILVYNMQDDSLIGEFDSSRIGGLPVNIALTTIRGDDGKTNSGCDISGAGLMLLLAGVLIFRRR